MLSGVAAVATGQDHSAALKVDGSLWTWGDNTHGQIGDGTTRNRLKPFRVMIGVVALAAGGSVTLALKTDGTLWAWGYNREGGLGDGTSQNRTRPIRVMAGVVAMAAGGFHTLARTNDGNLWAWGSNRWGRLGDGTRTDRLTPVRVIGFGPTDSVPRAPSSLVARTVSAARIDLRWADNSSDEQGFRVERRHGTDNWTEIATLGPNATSYANSGLRSGTTYSYRVSAYNTSGNSGYSNTATATTPGTRPCEDGQIPINVGATVAGRLSTTDCFANLTRPGHYRDNHVLQAIAGRTYSIELSSSTFDTYLNLLATGATILASDNDGGGGTNSRIIYRATSTRTLRIQATSNFTGATGSYVLSLREGSGPSGPAAPSNLVARAASRNQINLTWRDRSTNEQGFRIERKIGTAPWVQIAEVAANTTSYANVGLSPNTAYRYRVRAFNAGGTSTDPTATAVRTPR